MNFYEFAGSHPFVCLSLALLAVMAVEVVTKATLLAYNRRLRHKNIAAQGWPPAHCDADGDLVEAVLAAVNKDD